MQHYFFPILIMAGAATCARAQAGFYQKIWPADTLTNTQSDTFSIPVALRDENVYSFQINATQLTGTTAATARIQASNDNGLTWANIVGDTVALAGTSAGFILGNSIATRLRVIVTQTGTSSTKYNVAAIIRKRQF